MGKLNSLSVIKKPKVFLPLAFLILIAAAFALAVHNLNSPAVGTVTTPNANSVATIKQETSDKTYSDKYLSFKYPGVFENRSVQKQPGYLDSISYINSSVHDQLINMALFRGSFSNDSGVSFRKDRPQEYKVEASSPLAIVFSKNDGMEYTGFIQHGGYELTISVTAVSPRNLSSIYDTIAQSLQWKV